MNDYQAFLTSKHQAIKQVGFDVSPEQINSKLFLFQRDIVRWSLKLGKSATFLECGLGKTFIQIEWARLVAERTGGKVLILAPLAVAHQTVREGDKLGVPVHYALDDTSIDTHAIVVTNYERLDKFMPGAFSGVVLDESSILKAFSGKTKNQIIGAFARTPYKLACTATPAPNDILELGNHAEFLDVMPSNQMIARWFINDSMKAGNYRLKRHAEKDFWRWLTSWAVCLSKPGDLGEQYDMPEFVLPKLTINEHLVSANTETIERAFLQGKLLPDWNPSSTELAAVKRDSLQDRIARVVEIESAIPKDEPVLIWCDLNDEADALMEVFPANRVEVRGSHSQAIKETRLIDFAEGRARMLITKPDIAGFGLNFQHCAHQIRVGASFSFEKIYQELRRSWRYGQVNPVTYDIIYGETEGNVMEILTKKQAQFTGMQLAMNEAMREHGFFLRGDGKRTLQTSGGTRPIILPSWLKTKEA